MPLRTRPSAYLHKLCFPTPPFSRNRPSVHLSATSVRSPQAEESPASKLLTAPPLEKMSISVRVMPLIPLSLQQMRLAWLMWQNASLRPYSRRHPDEQFVAERPEHAVETRRTSYEQDLRCLWDKLRKFPPAAPALPPRSRPGRRDRRCAG